MNIEMVQELKLYAVNDRYLYEQARYICKNLAKKQVKGIYEEEKAVKAFFYLANEATKRYNKEFAGLYRWYDLANTATRKQIATELLSYYQEDIQELVEDL